MCLTVRKSGSSAGNSPEPPAQLLHIKLPSSTEKKSLAGSKSPYRTQYTDEMLSLIDYLVDGEFVLEKKNISLKFRGSENQRILHKEDGIWLPCEDM